MRGSQRAPLQSISTIVYDMLTEKLQRRNQFRTATISAFPRAGVLRDAPPRPVIYATFVLDLKLVTWGEPGQHEAAAAPAAAAYQAV